VIAGPAQQLDRVCMATRSVCLEQGVNDLRWPLRGQALAGRADESQGHERVPGCRKRRTGQHD
jgi:hypothetical protein